MKTKICIARAVYHPASIYLLDNLFNNLTLETGKKQ